MPSHLLRGTREAVWLHMKRLFFQKLPKQSSPHTSLPVLKAAPRPPLGEWDGHGGPLELGMGASPLSHSVEGGCLSRPGVLPHEGGNG